MMQEVFIPSDEKAWELLQDLVTTEELSMAHWEQCEACRTTPTCVTGRRLMGEHIEAQLAAKVYVERRRSSELPAVV